MRKEFSLYDDDYSDIGCFAAMMAYLRRKRIEYRDKRLHYLVAEYRERILAEEAARVEALAADLAAVDAAVQAERVRTRARAAAYDKEVRAIYLIVYLITPGHD